MRSVDRGVMPLMSACFDERWMTSVASHLLALMKANMGKNRSTLL
jgi:hypothetical protein